MEPERVPPRGAGGADLMMKTMFSLEAAQQKLMDLLYRNHSPEMEQMALMMEMKTGQKRETLAYGFLASTVLFILLGGHLSQFTCNLIGFAAPAYASVKAIRSETKDDDTKWLMYWCVFGWLSVLDCISWQMIPHVQIYWLWKSLVLLYLALPQTNAAESLFYHWVDPCVLWVEVKVDLVTPQKSESAP